MVMNDERPEGVIQLIAEPFQQQPACPLSAWKDG